MKRWRSLNSGGSINDHFGDNELAGGIIFEDTDLFAWNQSGDVDLEVPDAVIPSLHTRRVTFSQLRSKFSALAGSVTKTEKSLSVSRTLSSFADHVSESFQPNGDLDETEIRSVFEQAITNTFGLSAKNLALRIIPVSILMRLSLLINHFS